jgi:transposase InsO family protein
LDETWIYSLCVVEGYSRKIVAGMASRHQDLTAVLQLLYAAFSAYGCPHGMVADNGGVFRAHDYQAILHALEVEPKYIEKGKPWQNLIEAQFKVQLRLADFKFEHARTLEEVQVLHAAFIETFNTTPHWAHHEREDGRRTPVEVLGWVKGRRVDPDRLRRLVGEVQFLRTVNRYGFVSVQRFYLYAEDGLSRQRVAIWVYEGQLRIEYHETLLAQYRCAYDPRDRRLRAVSHPTVYATAFTSPQLMLIELDETQWVKVHQRPAGQRRRRIAPLAEQLPFAGFEVPALIFLWLQSIGGMGQNFFPNVSCVM